MAGFALAYFVRFHSGFFPVTKGVNPFEQYLLLVPLIAVLWPALFYAHGLYSLKRIRSRTDELFCATMARRGTTRRWPRRSRASGPR